MGTEDEKITVQKVATTLYWIFCIGGLLTCAGLRIAQEIKKYRASPAPVAQQAQPLPAPDKQLTR